MEAPAQGGCARQCGAAGTPSLNPSLGTRPRPQLGLAGEGADELSRGVLAFSGPVLSLKEMAVSRACWQRGRELTPCFTSGQAATLQGGPWKKGWRRVRLRWGTGRSEFISEQSRVRRVTRAAALPLRSRGRPLVFAVDRGWARASLCGGPRRLRDTLCCIPFIRADQFLKILLSLGAKVMHAP